MQAWESFLARLEKEFGTDTLEKWIKPLKVLRFDAGNIYLEAKDYFQALWFEEHVQPKAQALLVNNNNRPIKIHLAVANQQQKTAGSTSPKKKKPSTLKPDPPAFSLAFDSLDPHCTFDYYHTTSANKVPVQLLEEATNRKNETVQFNPIYLHGVSGTGKTHLLMAMAHAMKEQGLNVIFTHAETFTEHVVKAIRAGEMCAFRHLYRNADVLCIDDIHLFSRRGATQEELFHTFNTLHLAGKQIVITANCAPRELHMIEPRLVSRFEWGIVMPLEPANSKEMGHILEKKLQALDFPLNKHVLEFLKTSFTQNSKTMARALEALILRSHLDQNMPPKVSPALTVSLAKRYLEDLLAEEEKNELTAQKIVQAVAEHYEIRPEDILGSSQSRDCVLPRKVAMYMCREKLKTPYVKIGDFFSRNHSTVMSSIKAIQKSCEEGKKEIVISLQVISKKLHSEPLAM